MNWKNTVTLGLLFCAALSLLALPGLKDNHSGSALAGPLDSVTADSLRKIEINLGGLGGQVVQLQRLSAQAPWNLPGKWPTRAAEVDRLVALLLGLRSRFQPITLQSPGALGFEKPRAVVKLETLSGGQAKEIILEFSQSPAASGENRFAEPDYMRLANSPIVYRLGPGVVRALDRSADYYQQRRLFPGERLAVSKEGSLSSSQKGEKLLAKSVAVVFDDNGKKAGFSLAKKADEWELQDPVGRDLIEPKARDAFLTAIPELWAEKFVAADPIKTGLDKPEKTLTVTRLDGSVITLEIGKVSSTRTSKRQRPNPPGLPPGLPPQEETVIHELRFAKVKENSQVFEIEGDRLKDVFVAVEALRNPQLLPLSVADATRVEIQGPVEVTLAKEGERWKVEKPFRADADSEKVTDLLTKAAGLEARGKDILDGAKLPDYGLDKPASKITITLEEEDKTAQPGADGKKAKRQRTATLLLGKHEAKEKKQYASVAGFPRVNRVDDSLASLVARPAMAYRGKRVLDLVADDLSSITLFRKVGQVEFKKTEAGKWVFAQPGNPSLDDPKVAQLASSLAAMEALEFVEENPSAADLNSKYGLSEPAVKVSLGMKAKDKPVKILTAGKARGMQPGYFARLDGQGPVFTIPNELFTAIDRDALAFLPQEFWKINPEDLASIRVEGEKKSFTLEKKNNQWKVAQPFSAPVLPEAAQPVVNEASAPKTEKFAAFAAKNPAEFGLDKPFLKLTVTGKEGKAQTLVVGKVAEEKTQARFARLEGQQAVGIIGASLASSFNLDPLDFLDPVVLKTDPSRLAAMEFQSPMGPFTLKKEGEIWKGKEARAGEFNAEPDALAALIALWFNLRADRFAAWGEPLNLQPFGLDKPASSISLILRDGDKVEKKILQLGSEVKDRPGYRHARFDKEPGVFVLLPGVAAVLSRGYLDYVPRDLLQLNSADIVSLSRTGLAGELKLARQDSGWNLETPLAIKADDKTAETLASRLANFRVDAIAAFPPGDLKPFSLDQPFAVLQIQMKGLVKKLFVGKEPPGQAGKRYVMVEGGNSVGVASADVVKLLLAGPLGFRDRSLAKFPDADRLNLERGARKAAFAKVDGTWKLIEPLNADADQQLLDDTVDALARLRADELVVEKPDAAALARFGLDKPETRWTILSNSKPVLALHLGKRDESTGRAYAMIPGKELVFLMDPKVSSLLLGEFRPRQVWNPPLDAVQVERFRLTAGGSSFEFLKKDTAWQLAGKPAEVVNDTLVNDTLAALAGLKLERYVADKGASLNLFGLDPAEMVIELDTPQGRKALLLGRLEGGSKRYYARVKDAPNQDVFLISEGDSSRLTRDLKSYLRKIN